MANVVQMGVDAFWAQLSKLETAAKRVRADLDADKAQLQAAYAATKTDPDPRRRTVSQAALQPLIHNNSVLRLRYRDLAAKFNQAMAGAAAALKSAGLTTPPQLGAVPVLVPVVAVTALGVAFAIYQTVRLQTDAQRRATTAMLAIINDPNTTPEEKAIAAAALAKTATTRPPNLFGDLVPILGLVAVILLGPQLLRSFGTRRAAA
jgi:hypothetical protein